MTGHGNLDLLIFPNIYVDLVEAVICEGLLILMATGIKQSTSAMSQHICGGPAFMWSTAIETDQAVDERRIRLAIK